MNTKKRTSLDAVFGSDAPPTHRPKDGHDRQQATGPSMEHADAMAPAQGREVMPKRPRVKQHTAYLPVAVHEQIRRLAFEENRKIHDYLIEGLDRVFADRGLPAIKDLI